MKKRHHLLFVAAASVAACSSNDTTDAGDAGDAGAAHDAAPPRADASVDGGSDASTPEGGASDGSTPEGGASDGGRDALARSFVYVGCNRLQKADWTAATNPSSANLPQLQRTFADVTALADAPSWFFFTGDLVLGLDADATRLASQLDGWASVFKGDPSGIAAKVPLVPLVGNHEMLQKVASDAGKVEITLPGADAVWTAWIAKNGWDAHAGNGPTSAPPNADALQDDQSKLTYSFDDGDTHYVVLDTDSWTTTADPTTGSTQIGWIALHWLQNDLQAAQANSKTRHIFLFGHKPIVAPSGATNSDEAINPALTGDLEALLDGTPKVDAYLCAHAHEWDARKLPGKRGVYQVIAGNGGSQLETAWTGGASGPYYGFTEVRVYASGAVGVVSHARPVPTPYTQGPAPAATAQPELPIVAAH